MTSDARTPVIVAAVRTPIGRFRGALASVRPDDLAAHVIRCLAEHHGAAMEQLADVYLGCANQAGEDNRNVARMATLLAGLPVEIPGVTVNRLCGSGMEAVLQAAKSIMVGEGEVYIAGGVESMTRAPFVGLKIKQYIAGTRRPRAALEDTAEISKIKYAPSMTIFSSRGPNLTSADIIKPDITAPGLQILAGASPVVGADEVQGQLFQAIAGTTMSSPVVASMYALLKQAHPDWTPAMAKSAMMVTANTRVTDNDRVSQAGPFAMGAGQVDAGMVSDAGSMFNPGLVYDAGFDQYLGFMCEANPGIFTNPTASCAARVARGVPTTAQNLNYPSIAVQDVAGVETITRTVTSVATDTTTFRADVKAPPGYTAVVSPSALTLAPGARALPHRRISRGVQG